MLSDHEAELHRKGFIVITVTGNSMLPLIRSERDAVHIKKKEGAVHKGDIVLYKRDNGQYVLHRIMAVTAGGYTLCGDNEVSLERGIREDQVLGVMDGYFRDDRYVDCRKPGYRLYALFRRGIYPLRRMNARLKTGILSAKTKACLTWLSDVIGGEKKRLLLLVFLSMFQGFIFPAIAILLKGLIDMAISGSKENLIAYSGAMLVLVVIQVFIHTANKTHEYKAASNIKKSIRTRTFHHVLSSAYLSVSSYHSGEIVSRIIWDTNFISETLVTAFPNIVLRITQISMLLVYLFYLNPRLALAGILYGGITMAILFTSRKKIHSFYSDTRREEGRLFSFFQESVSNILLIKSANIFETIADKAYTREKTLLEKIRLQKQFSIQVNFVIEILLRLGFVFCVIWCAFSVAQGQLSPGALTALALMSVQVQSQFLEVSQSATYFISMIAAAERLLELVHLQKENDNESGSASQNGQILYEALDEIVLEDVCYAYDDRLVLDQANLRIKKGDYVAITGISGIGKSTFMRLLLGVITPRSGKVFLGDQAADSSTRTLFTYVPQESALLSGSIRENITLFNQDASETQIQKALEDSCAEEFVAALPKGLETEIGEHGTGLSAGQAQRLAITRALLSTAPILLLDECTSALDTKTEAQLITNLKNFQNKTVIAITHREGMLDQFSSHFKLIDGHFVKQQQ